MLKDFPETGSSVQNKASGEKQPSHPGKKLVCSACRTFITTEDQAISVNNFHRHVFVNPQGLIFEVRCFGRADNLTGLGPFISRFTWFPGYDWQAVICSVCHTHLGWLYTSSEKNMFLGLIAEKIIPAGQD
ncbi:MAG: cereblon family protein [Desulfonatronovibrionaceae bacterium]